MNLLKTRFCLGNRVPRRIDTGADCFYHETPRDYFRQKYFEVLDNVCNEISLRFNQKDFSIVADLEQNLMILAAANRQEFVIPNSVEDLCKGDLDLDKLPIHLRMIPDVDRTHSERTGNRIKKVTNVRTVCQLLNECTGAKSLCSELDKLLKVFLTIPVTTATSERTFSVMRRLKTFLRSSMTQKRLNHVLILHCHKARTESVDVSQIASTFVSVN